jgi:hypothetical protein
VCMPWNGGVGVDCGRVWDCGGTGSDETGRGPAMGVAVDGRVEGPSEAVGRRTRCSVCDSGFPSYILQVSIIQIGMYM